METFKLAEQPVPQEAVEVYRDTVAHRIWEMREKIGSAEALQTYKGITKNNKLFAIMRDVHNRNRFNDEDYDSTDSERASVVDSFKAVDGKADQNRDVLLKYTEADTEKIIKAQTPEFIGLVKDGLESSGYPTRKEKAVEAEVEKGQTSLVSRMYTLLGGSEKDFKELKGKEFLQEKYETFFLDKIKDKEQAPSWEVSGGYVSKIDSLHELNRFIDSFSRHYTAAVSFQKGRDFLELIGGVDYLASNVNPKRLQVDDLLKNISQLAEGIEHKQSLVRQNNAEMVDSKNPKEAGVVMSKSRLIQKEIDDNQQQIEKAKAAIAKNERYLAAVYLDVPGQISNDATAAARFEFLKKVMVEINDGYKLISKELFGVNPDEFASMSGQLMESHVKIVEKLMAEIKKYVESQIVTQLPESKDRELMREFVSQGKQVVEFGAKYCKRSNSRSADWGGGDPYESFDVYYGKGIPVDKKTVSVEKIDFKFPRELAYMPESFSQEVGWDYPNAFAWIAKPDGVTDDQIKKVLSVYGYSTATEYNISAYRPAESRRDRSWSESVDIEVRLEGRLINKPEDLGASGKV